MEITKPIINYTMILLTFICSFSPLNLGDSRFHRNILEIMKFLSINPVIFPKLLQSETYKCRRIGF